jgi:hypothetical protein
MLKLNSTTHNEKRNIKTQYEIGRVNAPSFVDLNERKREVNMTDRWRQVIWSTVILPTDILSTDFLFIVISANYISSTGM